MASGVVSFTGSATATRPAISPSSTTNMTVSPSSRRALALAVNAPASSPNSRIIAKLPSATALPSTTPLTPLPVTASKSRASSILTSRSSAPLTIASAKGCSDPRSSDAARRKTSASSWPGCGSTSTSRGLPSVNVPVLSTIRVSTFSNRSSASAFLISTPA